MRDECLLIMDNLFKSFDVGMRFDLKGSTAQRTRLNVTESFIENPDITVSLKDNDFRKYMHNLTFIECLKPEMTPLNNVLSNDASFLAKHNLIDYSLLLGQITTDIYTLR